MKVSRQTDTPRFTTDTLQALPADVLKKWSRIWGGKGTEVKAECTRVVTTALNTPQRIKAVLDGLSALDIAALGIMREHGGIIEAGELELILRSYGYQVPSRPSTFSFSDPCEYVPHLADVGLVLWEEDDDEDEINNPAYIWPVKARTLVWTDERILAQVAPILVHPLTVSPVQVADDAASWRGSSHVLLDCMSMTRAPQEMQGLHLTATHKVYKVERRRIAQTAGWEEWPSFDGYTYAEIVEVLIGVWQYAGWFAEEGGRLLPTITLDHFYRHPRLAILSMLMSGFLYGSHDLTELCVLSGWRPFYQIVGHCLRALPDLSQSYSVHEFVAGVYQRLGVYSEPTSELGTAPRRTAKMSHLEYAAEMQQWKADYQAEWLRTATRFCQNLLTRWLYWLGIVALQTTAEHQMVFRPSVRSLKPGLWPFFLATWS